ncbi:hypothetical protein [Corynebacterium sp.]|uniref:hypothetical protein n=1 Tax=Corynebacterium sp. TaxID=1720 RepID=UPI0026E0EF0E|nr:hypothetical protein [Corynebacterium sp.]MDO5511300.1 hypothetical protein [Corynebacterium sp.]
MTNPHDPENQSDNPYPSYPSTPHPEDSPGYGSQPYQGYQGYAGYSGTPGAAGSQGQTTGDGKVRPMEAVGWGFRQTFRNWHVWIIGMLLLIVSAIAFSFITGAVFGTNAADPAAQLSPGYQVSQVVMWVIYGALSVFIYHATLRQVDKDKIGWGDFGGNVNFWPSFGVLVVLQVASGLVFSAVLIPLMMGGTEIADAQMASQDEALAVLAQLFAALGIVMVLALLISPLTMFMVWYAVDRRASFGGSFGAGFRAGARNYLTLLLFSLLAGLAALVLTLITFGLAMIIVAPALTLAQAYMFRQAAQGPLPARQPA